MTEDNPFLRSIKVLDIPPCTGKIVLIKGSKGSHPTSRERVYTYGIKRTAPAQILFGSFLGENDSMEEVCLTQHQILKIVGQDPSFFDDDTLTHLFLLKEGGEFWVLMLHPESKELSYDFEKLLFFEIDEKRTNNCLLYIPALAIG